MIILIASLALLALAIGYTADAYRAAAPATRPQHSSMTRITVYPFSLPSEPMFVATRRRTDVWGSYAI